MRARPGGSGFISSATTAAASLTTSSNRSASVSMVAAARSYSGTRSRAICSKSPSSSAGDRAPASSGRPTGSRASRPAAAEGLILRYTSPQVGSTTARARAFAIQPAPADTSAGRPCRRSSRVASASNRRKPASPMVAKISGIVAPASRSISASSSIISQPSWFARARATVVFPAPGSPTRITCAGEGRGLT